MTLNKTATAIALAAIAAPTFAAGPTAAQAIPHIDHAFVIVMENHHYAQIISNPNAPFINKYAASANLATNYFGVGHPSLTNYLEIVGGSNFGVINDHSPNWHSRTCVPDIEGHTVSDENVATDICPIAGFGVDAATPAVDTTNEGTPAVPVFNDPIAPAPTVGLSIADQLDAVGLSWKSYQENLPPSGADKVNDSDGLLADNNVGAQFSPLPKLYAAKHNPFVYFRDVQEHGLRKIVDLPQLYADLNSGHVPSLAFIAPNQCHDQHGRGGSEVGTGCAFDPDPVSGVLNPQLIAQGDAALQNIVTAIKSSHAWKDTDERSVIVVVYDENDYSNKPNQVVTIVDTNYGPHGLKSNVKYNHFSLLKTLEAGFRLPYLNHAADSNVVLMKDLFADDGHH
jgi:hypothetical protein